MSNFLYKNIKLVDGTSGLFRSGGTSTVPNYNISYVASAENNYDKIDTVVNYSYGNSGDITTLGIAAAGVSVTSGSGNFTVPSWANAAKVYISSKNGATGITGDTGFTGRAGAAGAAGDQGYTGPGGDGGQATGCGQGQATRPKAGGPGGDGGPGGPGGTAGPGGDGGDGGPGGAGGSGGVLFTKTAYTFPIGNTTISYVVNANNSNIKFTDNTGPLVSYTVNNGAQGNKGVQGSQGVQGNNGTQGGRGTQGGKGKTGGHSCQSPGTGDKGDNSTTPGDPGQNGTKGGKGGTGDSGTQGGHGQGTASPSSPITTATINSVTPSLQVYFFSKN